MNFIDIYIFSAFLCVLPGKPIKIGTEISRQCVQYAEDIADISYSQAETFSSALLNPIVGPTYILGKPKLPIRVKVIQALICSADQVVNVRTAVKNIWDKATKVIKVMKSILYMFQFQCFIHMNFRMFPDYTLMFPLFFR